MKGLEIKEKNGKFLYEYSFLIPLYTAGGSPDILLKEFIGVYGLTREDLRVLELAGLLEIKEEGYRVILKSAPKFETEYDAVKSFLSLKDPKETAKTRIKTILRMLREWK